MQLLLFLQHVQGSNVTCGEPAEEIFLFLVGLKKSAPCLFFLSCCPFCPIPLSKGSWQARRPRCLTVGLGHLLVMDAGPVPVEQRYRKGDHIPRSEDVWDVGLHALMGQKAISAMMRGMGLGVDQGYSAGTHQIYQDGTAVISGDGGALQKC